MNQRESPTPEFCEASSSWNVLNVVITCKSSFFQVISSHVMKVSNFQINFVHPSKAETEAKLIEKGHCFMSFNVCDSQPSQQHGFRIHVRTSSNFKVNHVDTGGLDNYNITTTPTRILQIYKYQIPCCWLNLKNSFVFQHLFGSSTVRMGFHSPF